MCRILTEAEILQPKFDVTLQPTAIDLIAVRLQESLY
jgi:hypothetical protein